MNVAKIPAAASASFDEAWYLDTYPDVAAGISPGGYESAYDHWVAFGQAEGRIAPPGFLETADFDERIYLAANPDVADAIRQGVHESGREHFEIHGSREGRSLGAFPVPDAGSHGSGVFDEAWYLKRNADIAEAVAKGTLESGYAHWVTDGRIEGRTPPPGYNESLTFDEIFYLRAYPLVAEELDTGRALTPRHHYATAGRFRGYLPNEFAERPTVQQPGAGGLWLDHPNALDLIEGRLTLGLISAEQAGLLHHWVRYGYVILPQRLPAVLADAAARELRRVFDGGIEAARFDCPDLSAYCTVPWDPAVTASAKALDLHWLLPALRELILARPVRAFLELLFERTVMASQSAASLYGAYRPLRRDTPHVPFSLGQSAAAWIALEDVASGTGELTYIPGSHKLPEHLYGGRYRTLWDAHRMLQRSEINDILDEDPDLLEQQSRAAGLSARHFMAKKGDVVLWHPDLLHGELAPSSHRTRAGIMTHYCPREVTPLTFERSTPAIRSLDGVATYATGIYPGP